MHICVQNRQKSQGAILLCVAAPRISGPGGPCSCPLLPLGPLIVLTLENGPQNVHNGLWRVVSPPLRSTDLDRRRFAEDLTKVREGRLLF